MKIFMSGAEVDGHCINAAVLTPFRNMLTSFLYASKLAAPGRPLHAAWRRAMVQAERRMVDSGAFSFLFGKPNTAPDFDQYAARYLLWLRAQRRQGLVDTWVELDLSAVLGYAWVHKQREAMIAAGLGIGLITVWHSDADWAYWLHLLDEASRPGRSRYVAIEGHHADRAELDYGRFIAVAFERGVRVHGFMLTSQEALERWPFYSVDSTSWVAPARYGIEHVMERNRPSGTTRWTGRVAKPTGEGDSWVEPLVRNARRWLEVERRVTEMWRARGVDWDAFDS